MADQDWLSPAAAPSSPYEAPMRATAPAYDLRPLTLGEVLDRTFSVYRAHFWLFCGIASIAAAVELVISAIGRVALHRLTHEPQMLYGFGLLVTYAAGLVYFLVYCVTQAATSFAMSEVYLGRPASVGDSLRAVRGKWYAFIGIGFWQLWSAMWLGWVLLIPYFVFAVVLKIAAGNTTSSVLMVVLLVFGLLGALVYGVIAYIRNSLAIPVKVVEGPAVRRAMRRSKDLAAGAKGRIFVLGLIYAALGMVVGMVEFPFTLMMANFKTGSHIVAEICVVFITFLAHCLMTPVVSIGLCLIYFDQRVRKEAFDLEFLLGADVSAQEFAAPEPWTAASLPVGGGAEAVATAPVVAADSEPGELYRAPLA